MIEDSAEISDVTTPPAKRANEYSGDAWPAWATVLWVAVSIGCFVYSLTLEGYLTAGADSRPSGALLLFTGFFGFLAGYKAWIANPLLFFVWCTSRHSRFRRRCALAALIACVASASFLAVDEILINEGGGVAKIVSRGPAYWWWLASTGVAMVGAGTQFVFDWWRTPPEGDVWAEESLYLD